MGKQVRLPCYARVCLDAEKPKDTTKFDMRLRDRFDRSKRTPSTRKQRTGFALFWLIVLAYAYFISSTPNFNAESHLYVAASVVDHQTLSIDAYHRRLGDESLLTGHYYSDKAPGLSLLAIPVYGALRMFFPSHKIRQYEASGNTHYAIPRDTVYLRYAITYLLVILPSAALAVLLWLFLMRFVTAGWAVLVTVAYSLGTLAYPYSSWFFSHQFAAVLLFCSFLLLFTKIRDRAPSNQALKLTALAGLLAGYAVICEFPTVLIAGLLAIYLCVVAQDRVRSVAAFACGAVPAAGLNVAYNLAAFRKPFATGYMYVHSTMYHSHISGTALGLANPSSYGIQAPSLNSLWQITFGTYRGLFVVSPVLLLFFVGLAFMWRHRSLRAEWALCAAVVVLYFLMDASRGIDQNGWAGGWSVASRHLIPMLPFMIVPIAFGLRSLMFRVAFLVLGTLSVGITFLTMASGNGGGFNFSDHNPLLNEVLPQLVHGKIEVNWGFLLGLTGFASLGPLLVVAGILVARLLWLVRVAPSRVPAQPACELQLEAS